MLTIALCAKLYVLATAVLPAVKLAFVDSGNPFPVVVALTSISQVRPQWKVQPAACHSIEVDPELLVPEACAKVVFGAALLDWHRSGRDSLTQTAFRDTVATCV
jgi:hypothetical protein